MTVEQENTAATIKRLQGCISDLISVLALPALWTGNEPAQIINTLLDGLVGMLRLDFAYGKLSGEEQAAGAGGRSREFSIFHFPFTEG
jgi:hypothetical protein